MPPTPKIPLSTLNTADLPAFLATCGPLFEHSPWIAQRTFPLRPFPTLAALHAALVTTMTAALPAEQLTLLHAHPDLVGKLARENALTPASTAEQSAAGLTQLTPAEIALFESHNAAYKEKFGFPFILCARENKKSAILAAFPARLAHTREEELTAALAEIAKIARLRLLDAVSE